MLFDDVNIYFEETNFQEKAPSQERLLNIVFH